MASRRKRRGMVFHEDRGSTPAADSPPTLPALKPGRTYDSMRQRPRESQGEASMTGKAIMKPSEEVVRASVGLPAGSDCQPLGSLSPVSTCRGIRATLDNNSMWTEFFKSRTEMILTKQGSRMFPYCRFHISGLHPSKKYMLLMDIWPVDNSRYEWTGCSWHVAGKAEHQAKNAPFRHPESPSTGQHWMQNPVSFYKLKLTNIPTDQEGTFLLSPMHRYLPRLHLVQMDKPAEDISLNGPTVCTFTFPQTEFMAVTAYQNSHFAQLKVDCNPFAKGLREDVSSLKGLKLKPNNKKDLKDEDTTNKLHPVKKSLKLLLANHKPRSLKVAESKPAESCDLRTPNRDQQASDITGDSSCSPPAQKLISELIREAHVSLQRCNMEPTESTSSSSSNTPPQNHCGCDNGREKTSGETPQAHKSGDGVKGRKLKQETLKPMSSRNRTRTELQVQSGQPLPSSPTQPTPSSPRPAHPPAHSPTAPSPSPASSEPPEGKVKPHKRPAPVPLPALALFLKQHSNKSKIHRSRQDSPPQTTQSKQDSPPQTPQSKQDSPPQTPQSKQDSPPQTPQSKPPAEPPSEPPPQPPSQPPPQPPSQPPPQPSALLSESGSGSMRDVPDFRASCGNQTSSLAGYHVSLNDLVSKVHEPGHLGRAVSDSVEPNGHRRGSTSVLDDGSLLLSSSGDPEGPFGSPEMHHPPPSEQPILKPESPLPDPECSFVFEALSPASSPEPLPSLPVSLTMDLDSQRADPGHDDPSVFKWHTVLPPPEPYVSSFSAFQSTPPPLHEPPLEAASFPQPQHLATPPPEAPPFQANEQSLPFPGDLSPLALQLPLSPTFSLDGGALSPTPSLADLVHLFSIDEDLGMGVEFSTSEVVAPTCSPADAGEAAMQESSQPPQTVQTRKTGKPRKKRRRKKVAKICTGQRTDAATYSQMQPNLEEVEEQLFISFTSKEALKLHVMDSQAAEGHLLSREGRLQVPEDHLQVPEGRLPTTRGHPETLESHLQTPEDSPERDSLEGKITSYQRILLRDLRLMRHRQVIHPVLQAVGLKMNLLDPTQSIDLRYLGVHLPIPPPGVPEEPSNSGADVRFVSRTGKTTDVTRIKGWREKFSPSEAPPPAVVPEDGPSPDLQKKNLSAFCSDMLDQYLESEGKLIDQRADSFSQPQLEPPVYQLPTTSTSYVRTLDSILKKQTTTDLISGFIPPSKRPKLPPKESRTSKKETAKQRGPKPHKRPDSAKPVFSPSESDSVPKQHMSTSPGNPPVSATLAPVLPPPSTVPSSEPSVTKRQKQHLSLYTVKKRRKLKFRTMTSDPLSSSNSTLTASDDLAPQESEAEKAPQARVGQQARGGPMMTKALLRQKDLEDGAVWEGQPRTRITEERAAIALTSLFTLKGFVIENPTVPVQLARRRAPPCLNDFCRLGCVCGSLSHSCRFSHCGRPACMLGCSCLKQKVVLLKNLEPDSSPSHHGPKKKRRRRMKMAYVLKEADCVSHPAERVRTLWKKNNKVSDSEPTHVPVFVQQPRTTVRTEARGCARVRVYHPKKQIHKPKSTLNDRKSQNAHFKHQKDPQSSAPTAAGTNQVVPSVQASDRSSETNSKPSKRLIILAEGKWGNAADRAQVLTHLCELMGRDQLNRQFRVKGYCITPISQTTEGEGTDRCIQYRVHIRPDPGNSPTPAQDHQEQVLTEEEPPESWQQAVEEEEEEEEEEAEPLRKDGVGASPSNSKQELDGEQVEDWQREVEEEEEEAEPIEDWQREVEEEEARPTHDWQQAVEDDSSQEEPELRGDWQQEVEEDTSEEEVELENHHGQDGSHVGGMQAHLGLPFLTGISPAGFLSTNRKQPGGTDHLIEVNGKLYPLAKIQLGQMGALHPANRLAAYLTGRVGSNRKQPGSTPKLPQSEGPSRPASSSSSVVSVPSPKPEQAPPSDSHLPQTVHHPPIPEGAGSRLVTVKVRPRQSGPTVLPTALPGSFHQKGSGTLGPTRPLKVSQLVMLQAPGSVSAPGPLSSGQTMILKPVQTTSGLQFYRRPDGKLVQLVPLSQLKSNQQSQVKIQNLEKLQTTNQIKIQNQVLIQDHKVPLSMQTGSPSPSGQPPVLTAPFQTLPGTILQTPTIQPGSSAPKDTCYLKVLSAASSKEPLMVTCVKAPPPPPTEVVKGSASITLLQPPPSASGGVLVQPRPQTIIQLPQVCLTSSALSGIPPLPRPSPDAVPKVTGVTSSPDHPAHRTRPVPGPAMNLDTTPVETEPETKQQPDEPMAAGSSETEHSSDFETDSDEEPAGHDQERETVQVQRNKHNLLERQRRVQIMKRFKKLSRELGEKEKTTKISVLKKAVEVIQELRLTDRSLRQRKRILTDRRESFLNTIAPSSATEGSEERGRLAELMDELTENSSDEELAVSTPRDMTVSLVNGDGQGVAMEITDDVFPLRSKDGLKRTPCAPGLDDAFDALRSVLNDKDSTKTKLLKQAQREIRSLQCEMNLLKSLKICLKQQRDAYKRKIHLSTGNSPQGDLKEQSSANHLAAEKGGRVCSSTDDDITLPSSNQQQSLNSPPSTTLPTEPSVPLLPKCEPLPVPIQAPPTMTLMKEFPFQTFEPEPEPSCAPVAPPTFPTPISTSTPLPEPLHVTKKAVPTVTPPTASDMKTLSTTPGPLQAPPTTTQPTVSPVTLPVLAPPTNIAPAIKDKARTIPNILSRSKKMNVKESPSCAAPAPSELLSFVPVQPVLTMNPMMSQRAMLPTAAPPGMASLILNVSGVNSQQIHLTAVPAPQTGKIFCSSAPLTITNLRAANISNFMQVVQPIPHQPTSTTQQSLTQTTQPTSATQQSVTQTTQQPTSATQQSGTTTTQQPTSATQQSVTQPTQQPTSATQQSGTQPTQQPTSTTQQSGTQPTQQPTSATQQSGTQTTQQPTSATQQSVTQPTQQPTSATQQSVTQPTQQPTLATQQSVTQPTQEPDRPPDPQGWTPAAPPQPSPHQQPGTQKPAQGPPPGDSLQGLCCSVGGASGGWAKRLRSEVSEKDFLNQQPADTETAGTLLPRQPSLEVELEEEMDIEGGPWLLQLDSDSEDAAPPATKESKTASGQSESEHVIKTPPPLQQMKVGGATEEPSSSEGAGEGGVAWRQMPRLVPLGLRGHAHS